MNIPKRSRVPPGAPTLAFRSCAFAAGLIAAAATLWHILSFSNTDIAWLLTVGDHILDGAKPYADIIETNPPGSILLYMPAIGLARWLGAAPETMVMLLTALACVLALALSAAILRGSAAGGASVAPARGPLVVLATLVLMLLPAGSFGQRDHVIVLALLPLLARLAVRLDHEGALSRRSGSATADHALAGAPASSLALGLVAALAAGIGLAIKPYYGLGFVGPLLLLWRAGGWSGLRSAWDIGLAGLVGLALAMAQLAAFPEFSGRILPVLAHVYVPARLPVTMLLASPSGLLECLGLLAYATIRAGGRDRPLGDVAFAASLGFFAAFLIQAKGWPYHAYPALAAALLALGSALVDPRDALDHDEKEHDVAREPMAAFRHRARGSDVLRLRIGRAAAGLLAVLGTLWFDDHRDVRTEAPGLVPALVALGAHPRIMSLASDIAIGHPLVREIGGRWVGTLMSSWISLYVARISGRLDRDGPYKDELALEDRVMAADIRNRKPDAILASIPGWSAWITTKPEVQGALAAYRVGGTFGPVMLWIRRPA